jgi:uncharacterized membrane protein YtjA (UPF0391 family)
MPLLVPALLTMVAAQLLDLATFVTMVRRLGPSSEVNPIVSAVLGSGGIAAVVVAKLLLVVMVGSVALSLMSGHERGLRRAASVLLACAIVAGIFGGWTNALTIGWL